MWTAWASFKAFVRERSLALIDSKMKSSFERWRLSGYRDQEFQLFAKWVRLQNIVRFGERIHSS